jgi:cytochrome c556
MADLIDFAGNFFHFVTSGDYRMNRLTRIGTVAALAAVSALAASQGAVTKAASQAEADKAINARQAIFKEMKDLNAPIGEMLRRQKPVDPAVVAVNAAKLAELGGKIPAAFLVDTRGFTATKTGALDGIWASQAEFKTKADALVTAANAAAAAGKSGDVAATQGALVAIGRSCGGCHDSFRQKE